MSINLAGRTFLITRTLEGNRIEREKLEKLGAKTVDLPLIEIKPPSDSEKIEHAVDDIAMFDWIIFTSANGVLAFFRRLSEGMKSKKDIMAKFACVGPETRKALDAEGITPAFVPEEFLTRRLGEEILSKHPLKGRTVLLARAEEASEELATILRDGGARVIEAPIYRTVSKKLDAVSTIGVLNQVTDITLTSPSTVRGLVTNFSPSEINSRNIRVHCIGPVTGKNARESGLSVNSVAKIHTLDGLIQSILHS